MLAHPFQITKSPAPSDPESEEGDTMTMETGLQAPVREGLRDRDSRIGNEVIDRFYEGRGGGAGLYSEVRPRREERVIVEELDD